MEIFLTALPSSYYHLSILFQIASFALYEILKSRIRTVKAILHFFVQVTRDFKINQLKCLLGSCHHVKRPLARVHQKGSSSSSGIFLKWSERSIVHSVQTNAIVKNGFSHTRSQNTFYEGGFFSYRCQHLMRVLFITDRLNGPPITWVTWAFEST